MGILEESLSLALGYLPDIHLHGSLVLCALVLAWLAAIYRRASKQPLSRSHRRKTMTRTAQTAARSTGRPSATSGTGFRIKWDRTILAIVAVVALLTFLVAGIAAAWGAGTGMLAVVALIVAVADLAGLRTLALRDRKKRKDRRIEQAFEEAVNPGLPSTPGTPAGPVAPSRVFDAAADQKPAPTDASTAATVATGSDATPSPRAADQPAETAGTPETAAQDASGVPSVPRPTYLDAPEVHRPVPAPLETPQTPKSDPGTKLKSGVSAEYRATVEATANRTLDLDKVLERRRAV
jgi:hypothetical protein